MLDQPLISDQQYDTYMQELLALEEAYPELRRPDSPSQRVGGEALAAFNSSAEAPEYDLDAIRRLDPTDRDWAEAMLVAALQRREARAARALAALPVPWALDALHDASRLGSAKDEFGQAVREARVALGGVFH